jgi:UDP-glucose 4-epimerase
MDIAHAHSLALNFLEKAKPSKPEVFNLGSGTGISTLALIKAFEAATGLKVNYGVGARRSGDVPMVYANNDKAQSLLGWQLEHSMEEALLSAWNWEKSLA